MGTANIDYQPDIDEDDLWIETLPTTKDETSTTKNLQLFNVQDHNCDRPTPCEKEVEPLDEVVCCAVFDAGQVAVVLL